MKEILEELTFIEATLKSSMN